MVSTYGGPSERMETANAVWKNNRSFFWDPTESSTELPPGGRMKKSPVFSCLACEVTTGAKRTRRTRNASTLNSTKWVGHPVLVTSVV